MEKRITAEEDFNRLAEKIKNRGRGKITSRADFDAVYNSYMREGKIESRRGLRESTWDAYKKLNPNVRGRERKENITRSQVFTEFGKIPAKSEFNNEGFSKGRRVLIRQNTKKKKDGVKRVYRDKRGRFAKPLLK